MTHSLDERCVHTLRILSAEAVERARSGHPGMPMGAAPMAYVLFTRIMRHNPRNPSWWNRDRFVLSAGHGSMLLYSLLHLTGYDLSLEDIKAFRQWGSRTPGHPEYRHTPGVETTTGPLGQGFSIGVGMAMAERFLAARFNRPGHPLFDHFTYGIVSDGDLMEGISHEAASLAGHLGLGRLIYLYDDNRISIEGNTDLAFTEDRALRFQAYGWQVLPVEDGNDVEAIARAVRTAQEETARPSLVLVRTRIGFGSPNKEGRADAHGEPLGAEELRLTKERLGWPLEPAFFIPQDALERFRLCVDKGREANEAWNAVLASYGKAWPEEARLLEGLMGGELPEGWDRDIPVFQADTKGQATRVSSGTVLNAVAPRLPTLMGGSADLAPSNKTLLKGEKDFQKGSYEGRNLRFGVREHAMGGVLNGLALHGGILPYGGTFLVFADYMRPAIRLAALMGLHVLYVFTHDSIGLGEDGPTHQPVEHLASLRAIPNLLVLRPCDANETAEAWKTALAHRGPVALILTRQNLPVLDRTVCAPASMLGRGAYVLQEACATPCRCTLLATGSEVPIALAARDILQEKGVPTRVVSMPSWELFRSQPFPYRTEVLPLDSAIRVAIEAGSPLGWREFVGETGEVLGLAHFGASAPYETLYREFGLTAEHVVTSVLRLLRERGA